MMFVFTGCKPELSTGLPDGWLPMPEEQIKSYFPVKEGDTVTYISEENETILFYCYRKCYNYYPYYNPEPYDDGQNGEISGYLPCDDAIASLDFKSTTENSRGKIMIMWYGIHITGNRTILHIPGVTSEAGTNYGRGILYLEFENDPKKDKGMGWPKYPNEFMQYLTDEIELPDWDREGNIAAVLKSGKGLIWFTDYTGVKWYLQE